MVRIVLLGTASAVPTAERDTTALAVHGRSAALLVDCPGNAFGKLLRAGIAPPDLQAVVLTHAHADHIYGLPALLQALWIEGRKSSLRLVGLSSVLEQADRLIDVFRPSSWADQFPLERVPVPPEPAFPAAEFADFRVETSPADHTIPTLALRIIAKETGHCAVYSSDTRPSQDVAALARGATILLHECTLPEGHEDYAALTGHTTARELTEVARLAGPAVLALVHHSSKGDSDLEKLAAQARAGFAGKVQTPEDFTTYWL